MYWAEIAWHLDDAQEALRGVIAEIAENPDYDLVEFEVEMAHVYHHLNTAWNGRNEEVPWEANSNHDFNRRRQFPQDLSMD
jgi:hypothetical protein